MTEANLFLQSNNQLGECPLWDYRTNELIWIDVEIGALYFATPSGGAVEEHKFDEQIGFVVLCNSDDYILGLKSGWCRYNRKTRKTQRIEHTSDNVLSNRWNDGKCAPDGSIWAGTMDVRLKPNQGALYRFDSEGHLYKMYQPVSISNGLAWNEDLGVVYYVDSLSRSVATFAYEPNKSSVLQEIRRFFIPEDMGYPDGMTIDQDGMLWIAHWEGGCIARWHPVTGQLIKKVSVPAPRVTSMAFGGNSFSRLFITTARIGLSEEQIQEYPLSGSIFYFDAYSNGNESIIFNFKK